MQPVFISYEKHDAVIANDLCAYLENNGHACWIAPRDIVAGENYAGEIIRGLKGSSAFIVICSAHTKDSGHVLNEVSIAFDKKIQIIPYCIEDTALGDNMDYYLAAIHRIISTGDRSTDFKAILETLESGRSLPVNQDNKKRNKHIGIIVALSAIVIAAAIGIAAGKLQKSGSEATSVPAPAEETAEAPVLTAPEVQEPPRVKLADETHDAPTGAETDVEDEVPALKKETIIEEPEPQEVQLQEALPQEVELQEFEQQEEEAPDSKPLSLRERLTSAESLSDLEGTAEYYHVTINTSSQTLAESYLLICSQDGQIQFALSPQDESGLRVNLRTGEKVERIDYSKGNRVEYVKP